MGSLTDAEVQRVATCLKADHDVVVEQSAASTAADGPPTAVTV
jgi:hypothetical protein